MKIYPVISGDHWERAFIRALLREKGFYAVGCESANDVEEWINAEGVEVKGYFLDVERTLESSRIIKKIREVFPDAKGVFLMGHTVKPEKGVFPANSLVLHRPITVDEAVKRMIKFWIKE